ncbi:DUF6328 family protein [Leifsonia sp. H3M29-4]|uniref:DUF6328 family protein n=1 Tax=Salinibacterium metalliresistens TaxID=3031321 RepID=UPI0023DA44C0|nr:DUF6328 family protein [Salinibacterium metalliresistens]MDF1480094.1 DUF6328 family protein [Salinibacterium metalliresistens]
MSASRDEPPLDRNESEAERVERNWNEILQELRVIQTGTQILTGFLLALAFQPRFTELGQQEVTIYLVLVAVSVIATVLALAPVSLHRALFRKRAKPEIVRLAHRLLMLTLVAVAFTLAGTTVLIFDVVIGPTAGLVAGGAALVVIAAAWLLMPAIVRRNRRGD